MIVGIYILCVSLIVCMFILFVMLDRIKDIQDDMQLIRMRAFKPKDDNAVETYDVSSLHPTSISATGEFGGEYAKKFQDLFESKIMINNKALDKRVDDCVQDIYELRNEIDTLKQVLHEHEKKLNEIYIEE